ncbi:MAG: sterol desaturase, partial [Rhodothermales bacterium]
LFLYGASVFVGIYGFTSLMDQQKAAAWIELFRGVAGIGIIRYFDGWLGLQDLIAWGDEIMIVYFILTALGGMYFGLYENKTVVNYAAS